MSKLGDFVGAVGNGIKDFFTGGSSSPPLPQPGAQFRTVEYFHRNTIINRDDLRKIMSIINRDDILGRDDFNQISRALGMPPNRIINRDDLKRVLNIINRDDFITLDDRATISRILGRDDIIGRDDLAGMFRILGRDDIIGRDDIFSPGDFLQSENIYSPADMKYQQRAQPQKEGNGALWAGAAAGAVATVVVGQVLFPNTPQIPRYGQVPEAPSVGAYQPAEPLDSDNEQNIPRGLPEEPQEEPLPELEVIVADDPDNYTSDEDNQPGFGSNDPCVIWDDLEVYFEIWNIDSCSDSYQYAYHIPSGAPDFQYYGLVAKNHADCQVFPSDMDYVICTVWLPYDYSDTAQTYELYGESCEEPFHEIRSYVPFFEDCSEQSEPEDSDGITPTPCPSPESCAAMGCSYEVNASVDVCAYSCVCD